jgi:hypothetical protein
MRKRDAELVYNKSMERLAAMQIPELPEGYVTSPMSSTTLGEAFNALKADCAAKAEAGRLYHESLKAEVVHPLLALLHTQGDSYKQIALELKTNEKLYAEKRLLLEDARSLYFKQSKEIDDGISMYTVSLEKGALNEERKAKLCQRINQGMKDWKDAENTYKSQWHIARETRSVYCAKLVMRMTQRVEMAAGAASEGRGRAG